MFPLTARQINNTWYRHLWLTLSLQIALVQVSETIWRLWKPVIFLLFHQYAAVYSFLIFQQTNRHLFIRLEFHVYLVLLTLSSTYSHFEPPPLSFHMHLVCVCVTVWKLCPNRWREREWKREADRKRRREGARAACWVNSPQTDPVPVLSGSASSIQNPLPGPRTCS